MAVKKLQNTLKYLLKNLFLSILVVSVFFGALELAQRVRYCLREQSLSFLFFGLSKKGDFDNTLINMIDMHMPVKYDEKKGHGIYIPGDYQKNYRGNKFIIHINNMGFRGQEMEKAKPDGVYRIIIVGGSSVAGTESPYDETIGRLLQEKLNSDKESFLMPQGKERAEVINAGIGGQTPCRMVNMVRETLIPLDPDMIIVYEAYNQYRRESEVFECAGLSARHILRRVFGKAFRWFHEHSLLFLTVYEKYALFRDKNISMDNYEKMFSAYENNMEDIIDLGRTNNFKVMLVKQALFLEKFPYDMQDKKMVAEIEQKIRQGSKLDVSSAYYWMHSGSMSVLEKLSKHYGIPLADPFPEINTYRNKKLLFYDLVHLTPRGNDLVARAIFEKISGIKP